MASLVCRPEHVPRRVLSVPPKSSLWSCPCYSTGASRVPTHLYSKSQGLAQGPPRPGAPCKCGGPVNFKLALLRC